MQFVQSHKIISRSLLWPGWIPFFIQTNVDIFIQQHQKNFGFFCSQKKFEGSTYIEMATRGSFGLPPPGAQPVHATLTSTLTSRLSPARPEGRISVQAGGVLAAASDHAVPCSQQVLRCLHDTELNQGRACRALAALQGTYSSLSHIRGHLS